MTTTYNKVSHTTTTLTDINAGYGIYVNNVVFYVDDQKHYVDGAVVIKDTRHTLMANNSSLLARSVFYRVSDGVIIPTDTINASVTMTDTISGYGIRCNNNVITCNSTKYDCQGAIMFNKVTY